MILLKEAHFTNFRGLRDVSFKFAIEGENALTIIRAENRTGKTTLLRAFIWGLYGDEGFTDGQKPHELRLGPADWPQEIDNQIPIQSNIKIRVIDDESGEPTDYLIIRKRVEVIDVNDPGKFSVKDVQLTVLKETRNGSKPETYPEILINSILPIGLRDIFFFDGDSALRFTDKDDGNKRVEDAIKKLLLLEILDSAKGHLTIAIRDIVRRKRIESPNTPLDELSRSRIEYEDAIAGIEIDLTAERGTLDHLKIRKASLEKERDQFLMSGGGDRGKLKNDRQAIVIDMDRTEETQENNVRALRDQLNGSDVLHQIAGVLLKKASDIFSKLEQDRVIPNTLPEIVESVLEKRKCICGADVSTGTSGHEHLSKILFDSKKQSNGISILLNLSQGLKGSLRKTEPSSTDWISATKLNQRNISDNRDRLAELEKKKKSIDEKIESIKEGNLELVIKQLGEVENGIRTVGEKIATKQADHRHKSEKLVIVKEDIRKLEIQFKKLKKLIAEERAAEDLLRVVTETIGHLTSQTVDDVSDRVNKLFLEINLNDPEGQDKLVERVSLSRDYDLEVRGPNGVDYLPITYLSASQNRALTVAFILSLIAESGHSAVTVIDTPLGMTSGALRRSLALNTIRNSRQLVLLITFSEINGIEDILDKYTGMSYTMTNTSHYPVELVNKPKSIFKEVLVCGCSHRKSCPICKRKEN